VVPPNRLFSLPKKWVLHIAAQPPTAGDLLQRKPFGRLKGLSSIEVFGQMPGLPCPASFGTGAGRHGLITQVGVYTPLKARGPDAAK